MGVTVIVPPLVPLVGATLSHRTSSDAVQLIVPPPVLDTVRVLDAGLAPPAVPLNEMLDGETDSDGGVTGSTVIVTGIVCGEPVAPAAVTVMLVV